MADNEEELPIRVTWDEIEKDSITKIKEKQIVFFESAVTEKLKVWQENFKTRESKSELPDFLLADELKKFVNMLFDPMPANSNNTISINSILFDPISLAAINKYITSVKIEGEGFDFDVIHSPKCIYQNSH